MGDRELDVHTANLVEFYGFDACKMHSPSRFVHLTHQNLNMHACSIIQILTAHKGEWWKIVPEVKFNRGLLLAKVNSRPRLNFTEGTIIFYHSPNKKAVSICFIHHIHRFFSPYRTLKSGRYAIEFQIRQL